MPSGMDGNTEPVRAQDKGDAGLLSEHCAFIAPFAVEKTNVNSSRRNNLDDSDRTIDVLDRSGKKILNPESLPDNEPIISAEQDSAGNRTLNMYSDKHSFERGEPTFTDKMSVSKDGNKTIEESTLRLGNEVVAEQKMVHDRTTSERSFHVKSGGVVQDISFDKDSNLKSFDLRNSNHSLSYQISDGKITGVKVVGSNGNEIPIDSNRVIASANETVSRLRKERGLSDVLVRP